MQLVPLTIMVTWCEGEGEGGKKGTGIRGGGTVEGREKSRQRKGEGERTIKQWKIRSI